MTHSKDLFDDTTMTFGEHLEALRSYLIKALIGLVICVIVALFFGDSIVAAVRVPIDQALKEFDIEVHDDVSTTGPTFFTLDWWKQQFGMSTMGSAAKEEERKAGIPQLNTGDQFDRTIIVKLLPSELAGALHAADPQQFPKKTAPADEKPVELRIAAPEFAELQRTVERTSKPITLNVQEAFMMYVKVACIAGLIASSPWVFGQLWLFVAAGLYPHERRYVYTYLPMSTILFVGGCVFCFYAVFPFVLKFLLGFNKMMGVQPQIRLSEWISFAVLLPLMFGISFQLPLVMLFLERISIFDVKAYREKRRLAILVIAFLAMMLTPADPMSMMLMFIPLVALYELGIFLCALHPKETPFAGEPAPT